MFFDWYTTKDFNTEDKTRFKLLVQIIVILVFAFFIELAVRIVQQDTFSIVLLSVNVISFYYSIC